MERRINGWGAVQTEKGREGGGIIFEVACRFRVYGPNTRPKHLSGLRLLSVCQGEMKHSNW